MNTNIKVNGETLSGFTNAVVAEDGSMLITLAKEERTLDAIVGIFADGAKIEVLSGDTVTATYYNKTVDSVKLNGDMVTVHIAVNELSDDTADEINGRVDTSDGAIEELAIMGADHEERLASLEEVISTLEAQIAALAASNDTESVSNGSITESEA